MSLADFERARTSPQHRTFRLERISRFLDALGNPHLQVPTLHIAGTNGKGSTAAMLTSMLSAHGFRVGLFTSPHLHRVTERIRLDLAPIGQSEFAAGVTALWPQMQRLAGSPEGELTTPEFLTALAFYEFHRRQLDYMVIEVGLGGELDSTNVVAPQVCGITNISFDHVTVLGNTIERIARAKAGIIKPGVPVFSAPQLEGAQSVLREVAAARHAPLEFLGERWVTAVEQSAPDGQWFSLCGPHTTQRVFLPLVGDYQVENAGVAVAALASALGRRFQPQAMLTGLASVRWPGRFQLLAYQGRTLLADAAHSPFAMQRLISTIATTFPDRPALLVFGSLRGHDLIETVRPLVPLTTRALAVSSHHPRAEQWGRVAEVLRDFGLDVLPQPSGIPEALRAAVEATAPGDLILVTGSISVVGEVIATVQGVEREDYPTIRGTGSATLPAAVR